MLCSGPQWYHSGNLTRAWVCGFLEMLVAVGKSVEFWGAYSVATGHSHILWYFQCYFQAHQPDSIGFLSFSYLIRTELPSGRQ
jgi:hypothetical protein